MVNRRIILECYNGFTIASTGADLGIFRIYKMEFIILFIIFGIIGAIINGISEYKKSLCPHGIRNGSIKNLCPECKAINEENNRRSVIRYEASKLKSEESQRLSILRLSNINNLKALSPQQFEDAVSEMYQRLGYKVYQTPYSNDGGKDAIMWKDGKKYLLECKRYDNPIGRPPLQKFFAAIIEEKAYLGYFVTTSTFTDTAYEYAKKSRIKLINGNSLSKLMREAYPENSSEYLYKQMCLECGQIVLFSLDVEENKTCPNGHTVIKEQPYLYNYNKHNRRRWR